MANVDSTPYFENFDEPSVYKHYEAAILKADTHNIVIDFDSANAQAALNVGSLGMKKTLTLKVS